MRAAIVEGRTTTIDTHVNVFSLLMVSRFRHLPLLSLGPVDRRTCSAA